MFFYAFLLDLERNLVILRQNIKKLAFSDVKMNFPEKRDSITKITNVNIK